MFSVVCTQENLNLALNTVGKAVNTNSTLPILSNILITAKDGFLNFSSTNLELAIKFSIECNVVKEGEITVSAKHITSYVSLISDSELSLIVDENNNLNIKTKSSSTKIKCLDAEDFPLIPEIDKSQLFNLPIKVLKNLIDYTVYAASQNISRPSLLGGYLQIKEGICTMVCTNSYRLAERNVELASSELDFSCIIPSKTLSELSKILGNFPESELMDIYYDNNQILFKYEKFEMISRLIEGNFPDYKRIIPREFKTCIEVKKEDLHLAIKKNSIFARDNNNSVKLKVENGNLILLSEETKTGEEYSEITANVEGEDNEVLLNYQYILDFISVSHVEVICIFIADKLLPVTFKCGKEDKEFTYLIMPLKV